MSPNDFKKQTGRVHRPLDSAMYSSHSKWGSRNKNNYGIVEVLLTLMFDNTNVTSSIYYQVILFWHQKEQLDDNSKRAQAEVCKHDCTNLASEVSHFCSFELSYNLITISVHCSAIALSAKHCMNIT